MAEKTIDLRHYLESVANYYHPGRPGKLHPRDWEHSVMPLWEFGEDHLERILNDVDRRRPPERWFGRDGMFQMESRSWYEWHWVRGRKLRRDADYEPRARRHIPHSLRLEVYQRDGFICLHCGSVDDLSLDHIHPYSLGGLDTLDNLQTLCRPCNSRKGARV